MTDSNFKPYPNHKPSGVEWLGDIPAHWEIRRLRNVIDMRVSNVDKHVKEGEKPIRLCNYVDVYKNDYINEQMNFMQATATDEEIECFRLEKDDVLITKDSETWDDIGVPALVTEPATDLISGYHLALLRPRTDELTGGYLLRALQSKGLAYQFHIEAKGVTRYGLSHAGIKSVWFPLPPLAEQTAIVRYLDHADERIRRYIGGKQKLIRLLEEEKQAVIHRAVTRGLDPNVRLKDSGVEGVSDVPAHWEVRRLKTLCSMKSGDGITEMSIEPVGQYPVYGGNGLRGYTSDYTHDGDFALIGRQGALCGNVHIARGRFWASEHAVVATLHPSQVLEWFGAILGAMNLNQYSLAAAQPGLAVERVLNLWLLVPPSEEQAVIATHIEQQTADIDATISRARRQIELLQEYRTRLIADVVTGKLDVRKVATNLPDDPDDPDNPLAKASSDKCMLMGDDLSSTLRKQEAVE